MAKGFVVGVTTTIHVVGSPARSLYAVVADTEAAAIAAVKAVVPAGWAIDELVSPLKDDTAQKLNLRPGHPRQL